MNAEKTLKLLPLTITVEMNISKRSLSRILHDELRLGA